MDAKRFNNESIIKVLRSIIIYYVRNIVIAGRVSNQTEIFFANLSNEIYKEKISKTEEIIARIKHETINNEEFIDSFKNFSSSDTKQTRYLLTEFENLYSKTEKIVNSESIHIEHIMPRSNDIWKYDDEMHKLYVNRFGNLTLLGPEYNSVASNKLFADKLKQYEQSQIQVTKDLLVHESWGKNSIELRQLELANKAINIWPI